MTDAIKPPSEVVAIIAEHIDANTFEKNEDGSVVVDRAGIILTMSEDERISLTANAPVGEPFGYAIARFGVDNGHYLLKPSEFAHVEPRFHHLYTPVYLASPVAAGADEIARAIRDAQPATGTDVLTNAYERGRFDGVKEYAERLNKAFAALLSGEKK